MKKILLSISFVLCFFAGFSQSPVQRSTGANTLIDPNLFTSKSFRSPIFDDTTSANAVVSLDSTGKQIFTRDVMSLWVRVCCPKRWQQVGRNVSFENSPSITFSGTGETNDPVTAVLVPSQQSGNAIQILSDGAYVPTFIVNGLNSGGNVLWVSGYTYDVSPAQFAINNIAYTTPYAQVTLANSDPTFDRRDAIVANSDGTVTVITGTPSVNPQDPSIDPTTQVLLTYVTVTANTVEPVIENDFIYENHTTNAWITASSTARINDQSIVNPYSVPTDVEATLAQNGDNIRFTATNPPTMSLYNIVALRLFSKALWANTSNIVLQWYDAAVQPTGLPVTIGNNTYSFQSSQISSYQLITIPLTDFGALEDPTNLLISVTTQGGGDNWILY